MEDSFNVSISIQFIIAVLILKIPLIQSVFGFISKFFVRIINYTTSGSSFLFSSLVDQQKFTYIFAFQVLPVIIFFSALTSVLYHLGVIQKTVSFLAWILDKFLNITGAESLSLAGNIFLGQTESPILIKSLSRKNDQIPTFHRYGWWYVNRCRKCFSSLYWLT